LASRTFHPKHSSFLCLDLKNEIVLEQNVVSVQILILLPVCDLSAMMMMIPIRIGIKSEWLIGGFSRTRTADPCGCYTPRKSRGCRCRRRRGLSQQPHKKQNRKLSSSAHHTTYAFENHQSQNLCTPLSATLSLKTLHDALRHHHVMFCSPLATIGRRSTVGRLVGVGRRGPTSSTTTGHSHRPHCVRLPSADQCTGGGRR
jgi:hypothetical protein